MYRCEIITVRQLTDIRASLRTSSVAVCKNVAVNSKIHRLNFEV